MADLESVAEALKRTQNRELNRDEWEKLKDASQKILSNDGENFALIASFFRCLRNVCAGSPANQNIILQCNSLSNGSVQIVQNLLKRMGDTAVQEEVVVAARCGLQFLGNLVVQNEEAKRFLWDSISKDKKFFSKWLYHWDEKVTSFVAFLLFNLLQSSYIQSIIDDIPDLVCSLLDHLSTTDCEWSLFSLELFSKTDDFMTSTYPNIPADGKLLLLDVFAEQLTKNNSIQLHSNSMAEISRLFKSLAIDVASPMNDKKVLETSKLLTVLCVASTLPEHSNFLKADFQLLETCTDVLKCVHFLGKSGQSEVFSPVQSLSQDDPEPHPTQGFKAQLVRLLGNLVHQSPTNQDAVREMEGLPLLLDCCNIDSKNPFIMQWCILAIRNLTEGNSRNQEALAAITLREPTLVASPLLRELGLELTPDGQLASRWNTGSS